MHESLGTIAHVSVKLYTHSFAAKTRVSASVRAFHADLLWTVDLMQGLQNGGEGVVLAGDPGGQGAGRS